MERTTQKIVYQINETCIGCGACTVACEVKAIFQVEGKYKIDQQVCINCGACIELCPVNAFNIKENYKTKGINHEDSNRDR